MKKYLAYIVLGIGMYLCTCLTLLILNLIGIGNFVNIIGDAFRVFLLAGVIWLLPNLFSKMKSNKYNEHNPPYES
ncbi:MAG: hypothetical protein R3Y63_15930 [Eubacteriales bacterium]